ncbi:MAG: dienelactone hydrolase family protein [Pseudomonadota bacterium]
MRSAVASLVCAIGALILLTDVGSAQEMVKFEASRPYSSDRILLRAELFKPDGPGPFPAVVLMHGCGGWQPAVRFGLDNHARYLRDHGFVVLNLDSFGPRNLSGGKLCASDRDLYKALAYRTQDAFDALHYLQAQDYVAPDNIFLMGQSNGGAVAIRAAKASSVRDYNQGTGFRGVVAYYPWCGEFGGSRVALASPLLIFAGGRDNWVPARECQGVKATGADLKVTIYPEAVHSFDLDILPQSYLGKLIGGDQKATQDSREKMLAFFVQNLTDPLKRQRSLEIEQPIMAQSAASAYEPRFTPTR